VDLEKWTLILFFCLSLLGSYFILRTDWKRYGFLYIISGLVGTILCSLFVFLGFYSFPVTIIPKSTITFLQMFASVPFFVILGVRYSPVKWQWKIPFYWALVHIVMLQETLLLYEPVQLIQYNIQWDFWDSYTWWWIFLLIFEWIGGVIVPSNSRKPIQSKSFRYGGWAWIIFHFIIILTIFLGGFYLGRVTR
jgi:hypothetical protein